MFNILNDIMKDNEVIICECGSFEHQAIFYFLEDDDYMKDLYVSVHLTTYRSFFKRLLHGLKYIFGYKSRFGAWDELIFSDEQKEQLFEYLKQ